MKPIWRVLLLLLPLFLVGARSYRLPPEVREAKAARYAVERAVQREPSRKVLLFRKEIKKAVPGPWQRWKSGPLPKRLAAADVVFIEEKLRYVREWDATDEGGWEKTTEYFFRPSGSLAMLNSQLISEHHRMKVLVREYYDPAGGQLDRFDTAHDLTSGETVPEPTYLRDQSPVYLTPTDFFEHVGVDLLPLAPSAGEQKKAPAKAPTGQPPDS